MAKKKTSYSDLLKKQAAAQKKAQKSIYANQKASIKAKYKNDYNTTLSDLNQQGREITRTYANQRQEAGQTGAVNRMNLNNNLASMGLLKSGQRIRSNADLSAQNMATAASISKNEGNANANLNRQRTNAYNSYVTNRDAALVDARNTYSQNKAKINNTYYNNLLKYKLSKAK